MTDWKRPLSGGPRIAPPPETFRGTLRSFVDQYLEPVLPQPKAVIAWHHAVVAHAASPSTTLLVRSTPGFKQEDIATSKSGRRLCMTDNAPAWWIHAAAFSEEAPPAAGLGTILGNVWCWMLRTDRGRGGRPGNANAAGWYVAHVLRAKPAGDGAPELWTDQTAQRRFIRNMSPLNHFLVPKGNGSDVGERTAVIATIADWYKERYGDVFTHFLDEAGVQPGELGRADWRLEVEMMGSSVSAPSAETVGIDAPMPLPRTVTQPQATSGSPLSAWWTAVLQNGLARDRRAVILAGAPDASARLSRLVATLTLEQFVGVANAIYNKCDPPDVEATAPGNATRQSLTAWSYVEDAKARPRLGGKWARSVEALRQGEAAGLARLRALSVDAFVAAALRVESHVYRRV